MAELILTQATFLLCMAVFVRLFTFRRGALQFHRFKSCLAYVVMASMAITAINILMGRLVMPLAAWPLVILLAVVAIGVWKAGGNLAGVLRSDEPAWSGVERRKGR